MKVIKSDENILEFDNGLTITGDHDKDCCEYNYLDFEQLPVGTELKTMDAKQFAKRISVKDDGFSIKDINNVPKWVQARSIQNGYYGSSVDATIEYNGETIRIGTLSGEIDG